MPSTTPRVNAWIFLNEDEPSGTNYQSSNSCYQTLIKNHVYQSVDMLFLCFVTTMPTSPTTVPAGDGSSYTISTGSVSHPGGLTNEQYLKWIIRDARASKPGIKIGVTLNWGDGSLLANIFPNPNAPDQASADKFAANLVAYLQAYGLDGFDIDWESPICDDTTQQQFSLLINAIGTQFRKQSRKLYLTLSPASVGNLDAAAVNANVDFVNLQLYSGFTRPADFTAAGVKAALFAYGAKWESGYQTAQQAFKDNVAHYRYPAFTAWRLNSDNYPFEQAQQQALYSLVYPKGGDAEGEAIEVPA
ncbi:MAG TPA: glycoside hydrolase family 18 protein [Longimicrobium sp.]|jgi:hypothetical protein|uniref:glycoside hydrolase family 18 protein n=1 Tax=Longimicrobium sp. TaxID=2029185 RepID=UPI002ED7765E